MAGQRTSPVLPPGWTGDTGFRHFESRTNLERLQPQLRLYRLERMEALLKKLGSPERTLPVVHIAGSKGKGSTAAYTTSLLAASGYTVGLYMSPHVTGYRERFSVIPPRRATGEVVEPTDPAAALLPGGDTYESALAETTYRIWSAVEEISRAGTEDDDLPTTFELLTALAFLFFPAVGCDWIVLETGLGGRLDATNVCRPEVAVITRIELEHTDYLGDTIEKIATEKAGIIKKGVPVVCAAQRHEAADVFRRIAAEREAPLTEIPAEEEAVSEGAAVSEGTAAPSNRRRTPGNLPWRGHAEIPGALLPPYDREPDDTFITLSPRMVGTVQRRNIIQALTVYRTLCEVRHLPVAPRDAVIDAVERTRLPGRGEVIDDVYLDGAHTPESVAAVVAAFADRFGPDVHFPVILGIVAGKDVEGIAAQLREVADPVIVSTPGRFKPGDPLDVVRRVSGMGLTVEFQPDHEEALIAARHHRDSLPGEGAAPPILVTGSFYMVAEIRRIVLP